VFDSRPRHFVRWLVANVHALDSEHTPIRGIPIEREETTARAPTTGSHPMLAHDSSGSRVTMEIDPGRERAGPGRGMPSWLVALMLLGGSGAGGSVAAGISGAFVGGDVELLERDIADQGERIEDHDDDIAALRREQANQHRWMADELVKQSRALGRIAAKVGADVDVEVTQYRSEGL
jgi:hypothetical protein